MLEYLINKNKQKKKERSKQQQQQNQWLFWQITTKKHVDGISISETKDVINKNISFCSF